MFVFPFFSIVLCDVLQCTVRQVCHPTALWLLPLLGSKLGVQEEIHHAGDPRLQCRHHQFAGEKFQSIYLDYWNGLFWTIKSFTLNETHINQYISHYHYCTSSSMKHYAQSQDWANSKSEKLLNCLNNRLGKKLFHWTKG